MSAPTVEGADVLAAREDRAVDGRTREVELDAAGAEGFLERVQKLLEDLLEVKVVTVVSNIGIDITTTGDSTKTSLESKKIDEKAIVTVVKLTDGDVTTVISPDLLANADLRSLHATQVASSLEVLPRHIKELVDIAKSLLDR